MPLVSKYNPPRSIYYRNYTIKVLPFAEMPLPAIGNIPANRFFYAFLPTDPSSAQLDSTSVSSQSPSQFVKKVPNSRSFQLDMVKKDRKLLSPYHSVSFTNWSFFFDHISVKSINKYIKVPPSSMVKIYIFAKTRNS